MFCRRCGAEMRQDASFCPKCGARRPSVSDDAAVVSVARPPDPALSAEVEERPAPTRPWLAPLLAVVLVLLMAATVLLWRNAHPAAPLAGEGAASAATATSSPVVTTAGTGSAPAAGSGAGTEDVQSDATPIFNEFDSVNDAIDGAAGRINRDLDGGRVSDGTLAQVRDLLARAERVRDEAKAATGDDRLPLLVRALELDVQRIQALVDGAEASQRGADYAPYFKRGHDVKFGELGYTLDGDNRAVPASGGLLDRLRSSFLEGE